MSPTQTTDGSNRRYTNITVDEFETFLDSIAQFEQDDDADANEAVYTISLPHDELEVRIFSTINPDGNARNCGNDAIRTVVWHTEDEVPVGGREKTLRIAPTDSNPEGWKANLRPKIEDLVLNWREYYGGSCPRCGATLALRDGSYGEFLGCTNYPDCDHTEDVDE